MEAGPLGYVVILGLAGIFDPWLEFLASLNPVTYLLEGMRSLVLEGWQWDNLAGALAAVVGLGAFTTALALWSLRARTS